MNDEQLEEQLRRFTVQGPTPSLRARVLARGGTRPAPVRGLSDAAIGWCLAGAFAALAIAGAGLSLRAEQRRIEAVMASPELQGQLDQAVAVMGTEAGRVQMFVLATQRQAESDQVWQAFVERGALPW